MGSLKVSFRVAKAPEKGTDENPKTELNGEMFVIREKKTFMKN